MCNTCCRRLECYHCYTARPAAPRRVVVDLNEPSTILKISGLEPNTRYVGSSCIPAGDANEVNWRNADVARFARCVLKVFLGCHAAVIGLGYCFGRHHLHHCAPHVLHWSTVARLIYIATDSMLLSVLAVRRLCLTSVPLLCPTLWTCG